MKVTVYMIDGSEKFYGNVYGIFLEYGFIYLKDADGKTIVSINDNKVKYVKNYFI